MNPDLAQAITDIQKGNLRQALLFLVDFLKKDPTNEDGWSCLYSCLEEREKKVYCLEKILKINPENHHAAYELRMLTQSFYKSVSFPIVKAGSPISAKSIDNKLNPVNEKKKNNNQKTYLKNKKNLDSDYLSPPIPFIESSGENKKPSAHKKKNPGGKKKSAQSNGNEKDEQLENSIKIKFRPPTIIDNSKTLDLFAPSKSGLGNFFDLGGVMYGPTLVTGGIRIRLGDLPVCFGDDSENQPDCQLCEFFSEEDCPLQRNIDLFSDAKTWFDIYKNSRQEYEEHRKNVVDAIYTELKSHGRPLHYKLLTRIIQDRYPDLELNSYNIFHIMASHSEKFEVVGEGVYKAK